MKNYIDLLGFRAVDRVTGFSGVITSLSFDLYGCIQVIVTPPVSADNKEGESRWFDVSRLNIRVLGERAIPLPNFEQGYIAEGEKGPSQKALPPSKSLT